MTRLRSAVSVVALSVAIASFSSAPPAFAAGFPGGAATSTVEASYRINPGDQLAISVYGDQSLTQTVTVLPDGTVSYPLVGRVPVGGRTTAEAQGELARRLQRYVRNPIVTIAVSQQGQQNVLVLGDVKTPGKYQLRAGAHVTDAIAAAGGLGPYNGDMPVTRVTQDDGSVKSISLQKLLHDGDTGLNLPLRDNSVVYVTGPNQIEIEVVGAVDRQGNVEIDEGNRLSSAIARAGTSPNVYADLNHVVITRTNADGTTSKMQVNMYRALEQGDRASGDPVLKKGDVVYVPMGKRPSNTNLSPFGLLGRLIGL